MKFSQSSLGTLSAVFGTFFLDGRSATILGTGIFGNAFALRSVWLAAWDAQNCGTFVALVVCLWNLLPPACATKVWDAEIFAKQGRHAAFRSRLGWPKIVVRWLHSRLVVGTFFFHGLWNLLPPRLRRETFGNEKFGEALALRSVLITTREAQSCGKLVGFAACLRDLLSPTWAAKILRTEFLARHRRHAAFRLRRGGARAKSLRYIAPGFVAFAGRGAQNLKYRKKGSKKKSREFRLVLRVKNHPVGWWNFLNPLL